MVQGRTELSSKESGERPTLPTSPHPNDRPGTSRQHLLDDLTQLNPRHRSIIIVLQQPHDHQLRQQQTLIRAQLLRHPRHLNTSDDGEIKREVRFEVVEEGGEVVQRDGQGGIGVVGSSKEVG